ncbi:hypothetical protein CFE70_009166 [Pyrenophora teres f. teres 0-1]|uniref:Uncharacterized protein n=2 Tax=Pyrenophora teres f. teres TaxID=97479 RepID=E3RGU0_PYRTT|nr:hypothetical protein PTT_07042 [Pyrenophora teres f. teres 0-1]KAE8824341.1 hypothetical protein HRS9139_09523 [Pyrenophora teres f. teres]KAE8827545.1 hypothetical protein PTNB85_08898 [Pyrenophora teres f. teres]KAE8831161.1 hypothetical protein HRS9122_08751 [Pyrenophora teres f. teres]KAE8855399.1 hypothetical protein PTNB29_09650 [Pyrenophora teres f. teres]
MKFSILASGLFFTSTASATVSCYCIGKEYNGVYELDSGKACCVSRYGSATPNFKTGDPYRAGGPNECVYRDGVPLQHIKNDFKACCSQNGAQDAPYGGDCGLY